MFPSEESYPPIILNYWWTTPLSWSCSVALLWRSVALRQTQTGGHRLRFVSPHERSSGWILSPSILSSSLSLEWVMQYWNHMPSWIPHGSSQLVHSQQSSTGRRHSAVARGALPASCAGSKYLHSLLSRVARWRSLDVLGYVKSNPPGCISNRLSLLEEIFEQIHLRESFLIVLQQSGTLKQT